MTVSGIKKLWQEVRDVSGLSWFRPYDTRHTALSHWAEGGMRTEDMMAMAGHMSPRMLRHYARISEGALRKAMEAAMPKIGPQSAAPFYAPRQAKR